MDNGPIATGASPGKLRQLNGNGQLFVGKIFGADFALSENVKDKSSGLYPVLPWSSCDSDSLTPSNFNFFLVGGVEEIDQLPVPQFRRGLVGCISELSVGKLFSLDLLHRAQNGQNVDSCRETFDF